MAICRALRSFAAIIVPYRDTAITGRRQPCGRGPRPFSALLDSARLLAARASRGQRPPARCLGGTGRRRPRHGSDSDRADGGRAPHLGEVDTAWSTEERYALRAQVLPAARHARKRRSACSASDRALTLHSSVDTHSMALGTTAMPSSCPSPSSRVRQHNRPTPGPGPEVPRKLHCRQAHRAQTSYAHARQAKQNCPGRVHARFRCHQHGHLGGGEASRSLK